MNLKSYIAQGERGIAAALAAALGISPSYLSQMAGGSSISPERCVAIEQATNGAVARKDLRPDDWEKIWPELAFSEHQKQNRDHDTPELLRETASVEMRVGTPNVTG